MNVLSAHSLAYSVLLHPLTVYHVLRDIFWMAQHAMQHVTYHTSQSIDNAGYVLLLVLLALIYNHMFVQPVRLESSYCRHHAIQHVQKEPSPMELFVKFVHLVV